MSRRCCRRTIRPTGSTRSPTSSASRRCSSSATCRRPAASAALAVGDVEVVPGSETYTGAPGSLAGQAPGRHAVRHRRRRHASHTFPVDGDYVLQATLYRTNVDQTRGLEHPASARDDGRRRARVPRDDRRHAARQSRGRGRGGHRSRPSVVAVRCHRCQAAGARPREGRPAPRHRRVPAALARRGSAQAAALPQLVRHLRRHRRAAHRDAGREGAVQRSSRRARRPAGRACSRAGRRPRRRKSRARGRFSRRWCAAPIGSRPRPTMWRATMEFYRTGRKGGSFESGIQLALQRILASPKFVLRVERDPATVPAGAAYRISDLELATRLSFFLWSSIPDDELLTLATPRPAAESAGARAAGSADAAGPAGDRARGQLRRPVAAAAQPAARHAGQRSLPGVRRQPAPELPARGRAAVRQRSCARTAACSIC